MLILTRKNGQSIYIGEDIKVTVQEIRGNQVRIGVSAPNDVKIFREEIFNQIKEENKSAKRKRSDQLEAVGGTFSPGDKTYEDLDETITIIDGLIGFAKWTKFKIVEAEAPLFWLQSIDQDDLNFLIFPLGEKHKALTQNYNFDSDSLGFKSSDEVGYFLVVKIAEEIEKSTVNLKAPIVINFSAKKASQLLIDDPQYLVNAPILDVA